MNNNIIVYSLASGLFTPLTTNGADEAIFNGVPDWLYEEEILASDTATYWSPGSTKLAYLQFNDTQVKMFDVQRFDHSSAYPIAQSFKYPTVGETNPIASLFVYDFTLQRTLQLVMCVCVCVCVCQTLRLTFVIINRSFPARVSMLMASSFMVRME